MPFDVSVSPNAEADLSRLPRGLAMRVRARLSGLSNLFETSHWASALSGVRGARTLESVLDGFALRYSVNPLLHSVTLEAVEDRRFGAARLGV